MVIPGKPLGNSGDSPWEFPEILGIPYIIKKKFADAQIAEKKFPTTQGQANQGYIF